jgi:hypothetical protein
MPLRALTAWDGHWALEVNDRLIVNGQDLGQSLGADAAFGFHLIRGQPFYFYERAGKVHISYAGRTLPNVYDQVFHNQCCERAMHNVEGLGDVVLFHALRNGTWYWVEAGVYNGERSGMYLYTAADGRSFATQRAMAGAMHWDRLDEASGFVQDTTTGKALTLASHPVTRAQLDPNLTNPAQTKPYPIPTVG